MSTSNMFAIIDSKTEKFFRPSYFACDGQPTLTAKPMLIGSQSKMRSIIKTSSRHHKDKKLKLAPVSVTY